MTQLIVALYVLSIVDVVCGRVVPYQYRIKSLDKSYEGHIHQDAQIGDKVLKIHHEKERRWESDSKHFLALSDFVSPSQVEIAGENMTQSTNAPGVKYVVMGTHFFGVKHPFIVVANNTDLPQPGRIEFYVVLVTKDEGEIVSNPVPFVVEIFEEFDVDVDEEIVEGTTIFAGALVGLVIIFAFIIPCVVRAKRRHKAGKPIFRIDSVANGIDRMKGSESKEPNWYGLNIAYDYNDEVNKQADLFTRDIINVAGQIRNPPVLRNEENRKAKLDWIHPHYQELSQASGSASPSDSGPLMFICNGDVPNGVRGILKNSSTSSSVDLSDTNKQHRKVSNSSLASDISKSPRSISKNGHSRMTLSSDRMNMSTDMMTKTEYGIQYDVKQQNGHIGIDNAVFESETSRL